MSRHRSFRDLIVPAIFMLAGVAIFVSLGVWQLHRREWKHDLIQRIKAASVEDAVALDSPALDPTGPDGVAALEFRRVKVKGRFDHAHERHVYALLDGAPGWRIVTPLTTADGKLVMVDRGFVPVALKEPRSRAQGQIEGEVELTGAIRTPAVKDWLGPDNDPARNQWHWRDLQGMTAGLAEPGKIAPFFLEAEPAAVAGGWPKSTTINVQLPDRHLEYALTWFGLAATAVIMFGVFASSRKRAG